jgi:hypothetical protein
VVKRFVTCLRCGRTFAVYGVGGKDDPDSPLCETCRPIRLQFPVHPHWAKDHLDRLLGRAGEATEGEAA